MNTLLTNLNSDDPMCIVTLGEYLIQKQVTLAEAIEWLELIANDHHANNEKPGNF